MIIYNPHDEEIIKKRIIFADEILNLLPVKHCFITGSFLYKKNYHDIDIFVVSRKILKVKIKKGTITKIDFNDLSSLFYHSISKSCIAKNILPTKPLKITVSDFWQVINEAVPTLLNKKYKFHKHIRFLILYTEYFLNGIVLDTFQLNRRLKQFKNYREILEYIKWNVPKIMNKNAKNSYLKRFFYTQAGYYRNFLDYSAQSFLYNLSHSITEGIIHG